MKEPGRFEHVDTLTTEQRDEMTQLRSQFASIENEIVMGLIDCRERSLALTALEEAAMWAMKAITHGRERPR
jgi:hypothetical protein